jgi:hypothetical protein
MPICSLTSETAHRTNYPLLGCSRCIRIAPNEDKVCAVAPGLVPVNRPRLMGDYRKRFAGNLMTGQRGSHRADHCHDMERGGIVKQVAPQNFLRLSEF